MTPEVIICSCQFSTIFYHRWGQTTPEVGFYQRSVFHTTNVLWYNNLRLYNWKDGEQASIAAENTILALI